jgi:hypothetical protein
MLFGLSSTQPAMLLLIAVFLCMIGLVSTYLPVKVAEPGSSWACGAGGQRPGGPPTGAREVSNSSVTEIAPILPGTA